jgi:hypothetical protein
MSSSEKDVNNRIALTSAVFHKLNPIPISRIGKPTVKIKLRLFNAACMSILLYGCETWLLNAQLTKKLDVLARICYRIKLGIVQSESHITNKQLYSMTGAELVSTTIRQRQLKFVGHCLRMPPDEPANTYALYSSNNTDAKNKEKPKRTYVDQISDYITQDKTIKLSAEEIIKYAKSKSDWKRIVAAPQKPDR